MLEKGRVDRLHKLVALKQPSVLHAAIVLTLHYYLFLYAIILLLHPVYTPKTQPRCQ